MMNSEINKLTPMSHTVVLLNRFINRHLNGRLVALLKQDIRNTNIRLLKCYEDKLEQIQTDMYQEYDNERDRKIQDVTYQRLEMNTRLLNLQQQKNNEFGKKEKQQIQRRIRKQKRDMLWFEHRNHMKSFFTTDIKSVREYVITTQMLTDRECVELVKEMDRIEKDLE
jgi:hypothetical protein